mgnify:CR=1 FL=1|jgi:hypothetical protein
MKTKCQGCPHFIQYENCVLLSGTCVKACETCKHDMEQGCELMYFNDGDCDFWEVKDG